LRARKSFAAAPLPIAVVELHRTRRGRTDSFSCTGKEKHCNVDAWPGPGIDVLGIDIAMEPGAAA